MGNAVVPLSDGRLVACPRKICQHPPPFAVRERSRTPPLTRIFMCNRDAHSGLAMTAHATTPTIIRTATRPLNTFPCFVMIAPSVVMTHRSYALAEGYGSEALTSSIPSHKNNLPAFPSRSKPCLSSGRTRPRELDGRPDAETEHRATHVIAMERSRGMDGEDQMRSTEILSRRSWGGLPRG